MANKLYNLYLDESETHKNNKDYHFCIAGIIVEDTIDKTVLKTDLDNLKKSIWGDLENTSDIVLHEKEVKDANRSRKNINTQYLRFKKDETVKKLYSNLNKIIVNNNLYTIGVSLSKNKLNEYYPKSLRHSDEWAIAMQLLIENFTHFLKMNNGRGQIYYEHISEDHKKKMRQRFYTIKSTGTMYISPYEIQACLMGITFPNKSENISGLQIADFIPNDIARKHAGLKVKKNMTLRKSILRKAYDGGLKDKSRFGQKMIP